MLNTKQLVEKISDLYRWLDERTHDLGLATQNSCTACGNCCDFDSYGHRLYVTTPELIYLEGTLGGTLKLMSGSRCPYQADSKCTIHPHRFASCRIFLCKGDADAQSALSEETLTKLKTICAEFNIPYNYQELRTSLNSFQSKGELGLFKQY